MSPPDFLERRECSDASITYYHKQIDECYHSPNGAVLEATHKFVGGINWEVLKHSKKIRILDVCFGLGYNTAAALDHLNTHYPHMFVYVVGLEIDKHIVELIPSITNTPYTSWELLSHLAREVTQAQTVRVENTQASLQVLFADARTSIKEVEGVFDVVFFDPFSPKKAPELWQEEFVRLVYEKCSPNSQLVTYSCARAVRETFKKVGFTVKDGPVVGRRGPATVCTKHI